MRPTDKIICQADGLGQGWPGKRSAADRGLLGWQGPGMPWPSHRSADLGRHAEVHLRTLGQGGVLGPLVGLLTKRLTNRYLDLEVNGLKAHCET